MRHSVCISRFARDAPTAAEHVHDDGWCNDPNALFPTPLSSHILAFGEVSLSSIHSTLHIMPGRMS